MHDVRGLMTLVGGPEAFVRKLDELFNQPPIIEGEAVPPDISGLIGQYAHGNEPSHHVAYLYAYAGAPWKSAGRVRADRVHALPDRARGPLRQRGLRAALRVVPVQRHGFLPGQSR